MKDKLREKAAEWLRKGEFSKNSGAPRCGGQMIEDAAELLAILDAEGDGGAVPDDDLPGMWSNADFTGGDPDERCHAARVSGDEQFNAFRLAYYGANRSLAPNLESFRRAYQTITNPARSGVVSDEDVRDAAMDTALITKAQKIVRDVWETWYPGNEWNPASSLHDLLCQIGNSLLGVPEFASAANSRLHAQNAIDAAIQGERHEH